MSYKKNCATDGIHAVIPKPRGNRAQYTSCVILVLCIFVLYFTEQNIKHTLQCLIIHFTTLQVGALCKGVCNFAEEIHHVKSRYHGNYFRALGACLDVQRNALLFLLLCISAYLLLPKESGLLLCLNLTIMGLCQMLNIIFGLQHPSAAEMSEMYEQNHCNVAQGLAWSYYVGYLKIVLPHLKDLITDFSKSNNTMQGCEKNWKLHILVPLSCNIHDDLQKADDNIQFIKNLPALQVDRAGIKRRSYQNSVYKIWDENQKMNYYCALEYATSLHSLYAMSQDENAAFSRQDRLEQVKLFCRTLEEILERSKDCSGCYQLIVYDENDKHFLSKTIVQHIKQQYREEYTISPTVCESLLSNEIELQISGSDQPMPLRTDGY
uniref:Stimulator of interferon genes protein n=1 Tax=Salvator merianae TaxID=96440 RepID=A0A8D0DXV5_SALMN